MFTSFFLIVTPFNCHMSNTLLFQFILRVQRGGGSLLRTTPHEIFSFFMRVCLCLFYWEMLSSSLLSPLVFPYLSHPKLCHFLDFSHFMSLHQRIIFSIRKRHNFLSNGSSSDSKLIYLRNDPSVFVFRICIHVSCLLGLFLSIKKDYYFTDPNLHSPRI